MGADATHRPRPADGRVPDDVLVHGDDGPPRRSGWTAAAAVIALAVVAVAVVVPASPGPAPALALRAGELVPRDRSVGDRLAEAAMHVEVVNTGAWALDLQGAALVPGSWQVDVVDRPRVVPGESVVLSLHREVACDAGATYGPAPEHLVLRTRTSDGDETVERLPVADPAAYGGRLDDALRDPGRACVDTLGGDGPIGDLVASWRARRAWPPVASG